MMVWRWDQVVHSSHSARLVFVGCPSKRAISRSSKVYVHSQRVEKVEKGAECMCGMCVRTGSEGRDVGPKARAQPATHKDRPFLLTM
jgi:hypothetical protein